MGTLASELGARLPQLGDQPRVYVDANLPAPLVSFMRVRLRWDVLYVVEHDDLRRASDREHYRLARELRRTLVSLDRDYFDDRRFPPGESGGVIVLSAPDERALLRLVRRIDRRLFRRRSHRRARRAVESPVLPPLVGRKVHADLDWSG